MPPPRAYVNVKEKCKTGRRFHRDRDEEHCDRCKHRYLPTLEVGTGETVTATSSSNWKSPR